MVHKKKDRYERRRFGKQREGLVNREKVWNTKKKVWYTIRRLGIQEEE